LSTGETVPLGGLFAAWFFAALGSAFAAADAALGSLNAGRLSALHEEAKGRSKDALGRYLADPTRAHSRWLVGRILFTALTAILVTSAVQPYAASPWGVAALGTLGMLFMYGSLAEVSTTLARHRADTVARYGLVFLRPLENLILPIAAPLAALGRLTAKLLGPQTPPDARLTETEVEWAVTEGEKAGALGQEPADMIRNVLELRDLIARDVMVPRIHMTALAIDTPLDEVLELIASEGHSRYPVYSDKIDNVIGLLYAKDLFKLVRSGKLSTSKLRDIVRVPVNFVSETQSVSSILHDMRQRRLHMAIVVDEFGGVSGIVTLEDILEEIVGDIRDEYDVEESRIQELGEGRFLVDASVSLHDLSSYLDAEIPAAEDYDSVGGLLIHYAGNGRVPAVGTTLDILGFTFVVREANAKRIAKVEIVPMAESARIEALRRSSGIEVPVPVASQPGHLEPQNDEAGSSGQAQPRIKRISAAS